MSKKNGHAGVIRAASTSTPPASSSIAAISEATTSPCSVLTQVTLLENYFRIFALFFVASPLLMAGRCDIGVVVKTYPLANEEFHAILCRNAARERGCFCDGSSDARTARSTATGRWWNRTARVGVLVNE